MAPGASGRVLESGTGARVRRGSNVGRLLERFENIIRHENAEFLEEADGVLQRTEQSINLLLVDADIPDVSHCGNQLGSVILRHLRAQPTVDLSSYNRTVCHCYPRGVRGVSTCSMNASKF